MSAPSPATCTYTGATPVRATLSGINVMMFPGKTFTVQFHASNPYFAKLVTKGVVTVNSGTLISA